VPHVGAGQVLDGLESQPEPSEVLGGLYAHLLPEIPLGPPLAQKVAEQVLTSVPYSEGQERSYEAPNTKD
jgi:hypothetical protein